MQTKELDCRVINEIGNRYGLLTVLKSSNLRSENDGRFQRWICKCDCGEEVVIRGSSLRQGKTTNCGCESRKRIGIGQAVDLTGKQFGQLTAIRNTWENNNRGFLWECICKCGNHCLHPAKNLTSHNVANCGCVRRPKTEQELILRYYKENKKKANLKNKEFNLSIEEFANLVKGDCVYCGAHPKESKRSNKGNVLICNGVDRVDNNIGYIYSNCVSACGNCNHMKFTLSKDVFLDHIKKIYFFQLLQNKS